MPRAWGYSYGMLPAVPFHIMLDGHHDQWRGVLRFKTPTSLWALDESERKANLVWIMEADVKPTASRVKRVWRELGDYISEFYARENESVKRDGFL